jgi:hypothetical protein
MSNNKFAGMNHEDSVSLTRSIMSILDSWGLHGESLMAVLDLPDGTPKRALRKYRDNTPFPDSENVYNRLEHIIGIADALRTTYPHNPPMGILWLQQRNKQFQNRIPLQIIIDDGIAGLMEVRAHLDCAYDWQINP